MENVSNYFFFFLKEIVRTRVEVEIDKLKKSIIVYILATRMTTTVVAMK